MCALSVANQQAVSGDDVTGVGFCVAQGQAQAVTPVCGSLISVQLVISSRACIASSCCVACAFVCARMCFEVWFAAVLALAPWPLPAV